MHHGKLLRVRFPGALWLPAGLGAWALIALLAGLYANLRHTAVLPAIVTWDEWVAAVLFLPSVSAFVLNTFGGENKPAAGDRAIGGMKLVGLVGLVIFGLDLLTRAVFTLGWKPF